jgi:hypothetical protein
MSNLQEELEKVKSKIAELKEWNFGVCPSDPFFDSLLEKMWAIEAQIKEEGA